MKRQIVENSSTGICHALMPGASPLASTAMWQGKKNIIGEGGLDIIMTGVGFVPGYGWAISTTYFLGKYAMEELDMDFWNN